MLSLVQAVLTPFRIALIVLSILAIGMATGHISLFSKAQAVEIDCDRTKDCVDVCPNIDGFQSSVPPGFVLNNDGLCIENPPQVIQRDTTPKDEPLPLTIGAPPDLCLNIGDFQLTVPQGFHRDAKSGDCFQDPPPQVLGASTTQTTPDPQPDPQVLAESVSLPANK